MKALRDQCMELKQAANTADEQNKGMRTRLMALERELQKREKLLRQLWQLSKGTQTIGLDLVEKLREDRNILPSYRKKTQDLQARLEAKDAEVRELKRDMHFTRIIELQVEYASWVHEANRLDGLLRGGGSGDHPASLEAQVQERRVKELEDELRVVEQKRGGVAADLEAMESDRAAWLERSKEQEKALSGQQEQMRGLAMSFKKRLQEKKQAEDLQSEIEGLDLSKRQHMEALEAARGSGGAPQSEDRKWRVSHSVHRAQSVTPAPADVGGLRTLRRWAAGRAGTGALFAELRARDQDADGLLDARELDEALGGAGCPRHAGVAAVALARQLAPVDAGSSQGIGWLDLLAALDRLAAAGPAAAPEALPGARGLRAACLRAGLCGEELRRRLLGADSPAGLEELLRGLGLGGEAQAAWTEAWRRHGSAGLALRLPLGEAAPSEPAHRAWRARCAEAVRSHGKELLPAFKVWREDMLLTDEQFHMVCSDVVGTELSEGDIDDLALFAGDRVAGPGHVDGSAVLKLAGC